MTWAEWKFKKWVARSAEAHGHIKKLLMELTNLGTGPSSRTDNICEYNSYLNLRHSTEAKHMASSISCSVSFIIHKFYPIHILSQYIWCPVKVDQYIKSFDLLNSPLMQTSPGRGRGRKSYPAYYVCVKNISNCFQKRERRKYKGIFDWNVFNSQCCFLHKTIIQMKRIEWHWIFHWNDFGCGEL